MSNIYDHAHALARAIKDSDVYKQLKIIQTEVNEEPSTKEMLEDFRKKQLDLQMKQLQGEEIPQAEMDKIQKLFQVIQLNPKINRLLELEQRFGVLMEDINKIIAEPFKDLYEE